MKRRFLLVILLGGLILLNTAGLPNAQSLDPSSPDEIVKLIFIHHSTGENWLTDGYGNLGRELGENNYYVSDTNYGWGPNSIGDRTDIPDWLEWFNSGSTSEYMQALYNENGQHSSYTRGLADPGGENQIIMFKSCFPNSELTGSPDDPPGTYEDLSVSGAKYVYNQLLTYFATRPDKLFVVITAPPLSDSTYSANARAFNQWLMEDWLEDSNYTTNNVAVFDFYNVLTDKNAHHHYNNGQIEHIVGGRNTLAYPSGDDHPSEKGSRKATEEFIPLLNTFYHNWKANAPASAPVESGAPEPVEEDEPAAEVESRDEGSAGVPAATGTIDDFEADFPAGTNGWEAFWDEATATSMNCAAETEMVFQGSRALALDFDVTPNDWATCALFYDNTQDWSASEGFTFYLRSAQAGIIFDVNIYAGSAENQETYIYAIETPAESVDGWVPIVLYWSDFHRADWEENAGAAFANPERVTGLAFGMNTYPDTPNTGRLWIDELSFLGSDGISAAPAELGEEPAIVSQSEEDSDNRRGISLPCGSGFLLPAFLVAHSLRRNKKTVL